MPATTASIIPANRILMLIPIVNLRSSSKPITLLFPRGAMDCQAHLLRYYSVCFHSGPELTRTVGATVWLYASFLFDSHSDVLNQLLNQPVSLRHPCYFPAQRRGDIDPSTARILDDGHR